MSTYNRKKEVFSHGKGSYLYDETGNAYLDFTTGIAVNALGHAPDQLVEVIKNQAEKLLHTSNLYWTKPQLDLAELLVKASDFTSVFFANSGTESVEAALKLSRKYGRRINEQKNQILYFKGSFHGRSMGALSVTSNPKYQGVSLPLIPETHEVSLNNFEASVNDNTCAIIVEPIQGEDGVKPIEIDTLYKIRSLADKYNALLIFDEVQCGIGRTGSLYSYQRTGVKPDIICLAKGLGGGLPIGAILANEKASVFEPGDHGSTFGGNPLVCAGAAHVIKTINNAEFLNSVLDKSEYLFSKLATLKNNYPVIKDIRGKGLLVGIEMVGDHKVFVDKLYEQKILTVPAGSNTIRVLPPLNVSYKELDLFIEGFELVLKTHGSIV